MEERIENVGEGNRGAGTEAEIPRVASGLHSEDSVIDIESGLPTEPKFQNRPNRPYQNPRTPSLPPTEFRNSPRG